MTSRISLGAAALLAALFATSAMAQDPPPAAFNQKVNVNIPSQPVADALRELAEQSGVAIIIASELGRDIQAPALVGSYSAAEAIERLIPKQLHAEYLDGRTAAVLSKRASKQSVAGIMGRRTSELQTALSDTGGSSQEAEKEKSRQGDRFRMAQTTAGQGPGSSSVGSEGAQSQATAGEKLEEVIVTAQKREERLIDVPISIVALGADELQNRKLTSLDDLQFAVPGMAVSSDGFGNKIELRGVANDLAAAPLVGIYIDEVAVTNSGAVQINPNTYDLERVEVLRGPQGTLYGEGSAGGTIRFITKNPVLDRFGMTADVASLFTQDGSPSERINTVINVPLIDSEFGVRIVGTYDREGGWIDQPAAGLKDINGQDLTNVRIKSLWQPSSRFSASFMAELYRNDKSIDTNEDARGNFTQVFYLTTTPKVREEHDIYNLTLSYESSAVRILSSTSYLREKVEVKDLGYSYTYLGLPGMPSLTYNLLNPYSLSNDHAWSEELRLSSSGSGPWQWTIGGFYRHYRDFFDQPTTYYDLLGPPGTPLPSPYGLNLADVLFKSWSAFGDINYTLWERFTLGLGVRSFRERQDHIAVADLGDGPVQTGQTGIFHSVDPRVYAQYKLSRDINIYASAAKGFRSGGFNASPTQPTFGPEDVRSYELGTKMSLLEGKLRADTAIFYTDYKNFVVSGIAHAGDLNPSFANAGNARLEGVDWDVVWRPSHQWSLGVNGEYVDTRFTKINATSTAYAVGDPLDFVPKYQMTSSVERYFTWSGKQVSMRLDYTRRARETFRVRSIVPEYYRESDVINMLGYYMNMHWSESLSFNLFAQNLLNDRGLTRPDTGATARSRPRTYGVGFDVSL